MPDYTIPMDVLNQTLPKYSPKIYDSVLKHNALLNNLRKKGKVKEVDGGSTIIETIYAKENSTTKWMSPNEAISLDVTQITARAEYEFRLAETTVGITFDEEKMNQAGPQQLYAIMKGRVENAEYTMQNMIAHDLFNNGSDNKALEGIPFLVSDNPASQTSVGKIDRTLAANSWWRNQTLNLKTYFSLATGALPTPAQFAQSMNIMWQKTQVGSDHVTAIYAGDTFYNLYYEFLIDKRRITGTEKIGDVEFDSLEFRGVPVYREPNCDNNHMYFLNENYLWFKYMKGCNFTFLPKRVPTDYLKEIVPLVFYGNLTMGNALKQGVIYLGL